MRRAVNLVSRARPVYVQPVAFVSARGALSTLRPQLTPSLPIYARRHLSDTPLDSLPKLDLGVGEHVVVEARAGPSQPNAWAGHAQLALSGGAQALTLVIRSDPASPSDEVWADAPEGKDHIKQWHANLVESLLGILVAHLPTTSIRVVGLETVGREGEEGEGYVKGWVETTVSQWCNLESEAAVEEIKERDENKGRDVYTLPETAAAIAKAGKPMRNLQLISLAAFEGRPEEDKKHNHDRDHGHSCGPTCNH
ncbi:hypothetical protein CspeluHIS016_0901460 [Cutaneotrichosporon spelunceum]|uniref:Uncharacterized protein n=1 Tax=Cutaneotrichosporon spelunceum TaxID=1672016 RepID=A0AAD3U0C6_9TREE|nr:hypothetical protein CspeluHIS016_0901460 [Cutaneotrichosporon spelunceum]